MHYLLIPLVFLEFFFNFNLFRCSLNQSYFAYFLHAGRPPFVLYIAISRSQSDKFNFYDFLKIETSFLLRSSLNSIFKTFNSSRFSSTNSGVGMEGRFKGLNPFIEYHFFFFSNFNKRLSY